MSANVCTDNHIAYLLAAAIETARLEAQGYEFTWKPPDGETKTLTEQNFQETGQMLRDANLKNVRHLYPHREISDFIPGAETFQPTGYTMRAFARHDLVQVIKSAHCFRHQCDHDTNWRDTEAQSLINNLLEQTCRVMYDHEQYQWGEPQNMEQTMRVIQKGETE